MKCPACNHELPETHTGPCPACKAALKTPTESHRDRLRDILAQVKQELEETFGEPQLAVGLSEEEAAALSSHCHMPPAAEDPELDCVFALPADSADTPAQNRVPTAVHEAELLIPASSPQSETTVRSASVKHRDVPQSRHWFGYFATGSMIIIGLAVIMSLFRQQPVGPAVPAPTAFTPHIPHPAPLAVPAVPAAKPTPTALVAPTPPPEPVEFSSTLEFAIHTDSFRSMTIATQEANRLAAKGFTTTIQSITIPEHGVWHRVLVGPYTSRSAAVQARSLLIAKAAKNEAMIVPLIR